MSVDGEANRDQRMMVSRHVKMLQVLASQQIYGKLKKAYLTRIKFNK